MPQSPEPPPSLSLLQHAFAGGLRTQGPIPRDLVRSLAGPVVEERFGVYRNNAWQFFLAALEATFPVIRRRVGADFFRRLAREYRASHPSPSGDLHWVGAAFPAWLAVRLTDSDYAWLADLARLEWSCEESAVAGRGPPLALDSLATIEPTQLDRLRLQLQPSLRLVESAFPVWSVWQANQGTEPGPAVDLARGGECCAVACLERGIVIYRLEPAEFATLAALQAGHDLGTALDVEGIDADGLGRTLAWAFAADLVTGLSPSAPA